MPRRRAAVVFLAWLAAALFAPARALDINVVSGDWQPINIVVEGASIDEDDPAAYNPAAIVAADLTASGQFRVTLLSPSAGGGLQSAQERGAEYILRVRAGGDAVGGRVDFSLQDALFGKDGFTGKDKVGSYQYIYEAGNRRLVAHTIANAVYEKIIGKSGVFLTKVAYVVKLSRKNHQLRVADYDGHNRQTLLNSNTILTSPAWSPDGNHLYYVSFERNKPIVYSQSLLTGERRVIANFKGSNSAPAISPDGQQLAVALTEHGGLQQIYLLSENSKKRLRDSRGANTEPAWSPDGTRMAFTSDEAGAPQIYEHDFASDKTRRIISDDNNYSNYNGSPDYSQAGDSVVFIRKEGGGNNVAVADLESGKVALLTGIRLADSPSFSPNDDMVAFLDEKRKKHLAMVSINGKVMTLWEVPEEGNIVDPAWSPLRSDWF